LFEQPRLNRPTGKPYRVGAALFVTEPLREIIFEFDVKEHREKGVFIYAKLLKFKQVDDDLPLA